MKPVVAIVAAGNMGAGIGRLLVDHGLKVLTFLNGRSKATQQRAAAAGMTAVSIDELMEADLLLSILPPANALAFAEQTAFALKSARLKPVFVDCNAVSPATVRHIHAVITATGADFVDGGILGYPPEPGGVSPRLYVSGDHADKVHALASYGLDVRVLDGPVGAASALKMSYAGISKGMVALVAAMVLAAERAGSGEALRQALTESDATLVKSMAARMPRMYTKAWRWVAEMQEIAEFAHDDPAARDIWMGISAFYDHIAQDVAGDHRETDALTRFFTPPKARSRARHS